MRMIRCCSARRRRGLEQGCLEDAVEAGGARCGVAREHGGLALRHSAITDLIALHRLDTMTVAQLAGTVFSMI